DELGALYQDEIFSDLFPERGCPAMSPGRLAMITIFQFAEGLSDRAAADAVRSRIDWKYALGLELADPGAGSELTRPGCWLASTTTTGWSAYGKRCDGR